MIHYGPPEQPNGYQPDPHTPPPDTWEPMPDEADHWYDRQAEREQVTFPAASGSWGTITDTIIGTTEQ